MLSQIEFDALLQRYLAGHSRPGEQELVEQWSQQLGEADEPPLSAHLQAQLKAAMWDRVTQLTADEPAAAPPLVVPFTQPRRSFWREPALRWAAHLCPRSLRAEALAPVGPTCSKFPSLLP